MFLHQSCDKFAANSLNSFYCFYSQTCWIFKATIKVTISIIRKYFSIFVFYFCSTRLLFSAAFLTIYNYCWYWRLSFPPTRNFHYLTKIISITKLENKKNYFHKSCDNLINAVFCLFWKNDLDPAIFVFYFFRESQKRNRKVLWRMFTFNWMLVGNAINKKHIY